MGDLRTIGRPIRLLSIVGTRPEAIKMAPVAIEAARRVTVAHRILVTGQQAEWADAALAEFGLSADRRLPPVAIDPDPVWVSRTDGGHLGFILSRAGFTE